MQSIQQRPIPQVTLYLIRQKPLKSINFKSFHQKEKQYDHIRQRQQSMNKNRLKSKQKIQADQDQEDQINLNQNFQKKVQLNPFQRFDQRAVEISNIQQQNDINQMVQFNNQVQQENNQNPNQNFHQNLNLILQLLDVSLVDGFRQISQTSSEDIQQMLRQMDVDLNPFYQPNLPNEQRERIALRIAKFLQKKRMQNHLSTIEDLYNGNFQSYVPSRILVKLKDTIDNTDYHTQSKTFIDQKFQIEKIEQSIVPQIHYDKDQYAFGKPQPGCEYQRPFGSSALQPLKYLYYLTNPQIGQQNLSNLYGLYKVVKNNYKKLIKMTKYKQIQKSKSQILVEKCLQTAKKTIRNSTGPAIAIYSLKTGTDVLIKKKGFKQTTKQNAKQSYLNYIGNIGAKAVGSVLPYGNVAEKIINETIPHFTNKESRNNIIQAYRNRRNNRNQRY